MEQLTPGVDHTHYHPGAGGERVRAAARARRRARWWSACRGWWRARARTCWCGRCRRSASRCPARRAAAGRRRPAPQGRRAARRRSRASREHVVLAGRVPWKDTPAYYDAGDVFCMPTRTRLGGLEPEALGICYLEAAATGLPVVAGDSGGAPDAVLDGENGFVVDGRSPEQVADRVAPAAARPRAGAAVRRPRPGLGDRAVGLAGAGRPSGRAARPPTARPDRPP